MNPDSLCPWGVSSRNLGTTLLPSPVYRRINFKSGDFVKCFYCISVKDSFAVGISHLSYEGEHNLQRPQRGHRGGRHPQVERRDQRGVAGHSRAGQADVDEPLLPRDQHYLPGIKSGGRSNSECSSSGRNIPRRK